MASADVPLRIATRRSALARAQAQQLGLLLAERSGRSFELVPLATTGDLHPTRAVGDFDVKGLFVDTIRQAVLTGDCDLAVHSYKDLPTAPVEGLTVAAVPERADPRDVLVARAAVTLATLARGARVGTSSQRRRLQLLQVRDDLEIVAVRGNLDTRLRKVADGELDAVVVAQAGLSRLYGHAGQEDPGPGEPAWGLRTLPLEPDACLPAPAQGALAVEARSGDPVVLDACRLLADSATERCVRAERAFLQTFGGGCLAPVGALAQVAGESLELHGMMGDPDSGRVLRDLAQGAAADPEGLGRRLATAMLDAGGRDLLAGIERARGAGGPSGGGAGS